MVRAGGASRTGVPPGAILLVVTLAVLVPGLIERGVPTMGDGVTPAMQAGGLILMALALVQVLSYGFHDPVLTDRAFISPPRSMLVGFVLAALFGGGLIALFSLVGLYATAAAVDSGSTLDSTFSSTAKFAARDWPGRTEETPDASQVRFGRKAMIVIALLGNLPLLSLYINGVGPAVIAATTISGTAIMGLAPIFLLAWIKPAGPLSFHLALWLSNAGAAPRCSAPFGRRAPAGWRRRFRPASAFARTPQRTFCSRLKL